MNVVIKQDEKIFSFFDFIQKQFEFVKDVNINKSKDNLNSYNELYKSVLINLGTFTKFSQVIKKNLLEIPELRDDLFYYYSSSTTMILYLWNFLKEYLEQYIYLTLNNQPADFDYELYQNYIRFIDKLSKLIFKMFKLIDKKIKQEIKLTDYHEQYNYYVEEFEKYEKEFYLNSYETEESQTKNDFIKKVNNNLEFMEYELE